MNYLFFQKSLCEPWWPPIRCTAIHIFHMLFVTATGMKITFVCLHNHFHNNSRFDAQQEIIYKYSEAN